jgi:AcrR family transcriptional regulator
MSAADRRALLVQAAIKVMARDGVAHTTTRAIVAEADMQIGVLHYCFRSKEELVLEVMRTISSRAFEAVGQVLTETSDPAELIQRCISTYWEHIESDPNEHQLTYELTQYALRQPGQREAATAQYDHYISSMAAFLNAATEVGGFAFSTDVDVLARYVLANVEGITFQWLVNRDTDMAHRMLAVLAGQLMRDAGLSLAPAQRQG